MQASKVGSTFHRCVIESITKRTPAKGGLDYVHIELKSTSGQKIYDHFFIYHENEFARKIAWSRIHSLKLAAGVIFDDERDVIGKEVIVELRKFKNKQTGETRDGIVAYHDKSSPLTVSDVTPTPYSGLIKPIATELYGYTFRSKLESKWAVFFEHVREFSGGRFKWEYEPQGYHLSDGTKYCPDFRCVSPRGVVQWYEVKPEIADPHGKFVRFANDLRHEKNVHCQQLNGSPFDLLQDGKGAMCPSCGSIYADGKSRIDGSSFDCEMVELCVSWDSDTGLFNDTSIDAEQIGADPDRFRPSLSRGISFYSGCNSHSMFCHYLSVALYGASVNYEENLKENRRWSNG